MRMTNKIMQNNSLYNINNNKVMQDKLSTQMSTQKKITRPSDDPVIAIRALRLRTSVSELVQYHEKNAKDAESWLNVTDKSMDTVTAVLTDFIKKANTGANKEYGVDNLKIILEQMKSLRDEFYATGNVDYAGRYIFTGYRTDTPLSFNEKVEEQPAGYPKYEITEQNTLADFDTINYTNTGGLPGLNKDNYNDPKYDPYDTSKNMTEQDVTNGDIYRMRLAYDNLMGAYSLQDITNALPGEVIMTSSGYLSELYTDDNGNTHAGAELDFRALDNPPNSIQDLDGTGFFTTCCTCNMYYSIRFTSDSASAGLEVNGNSFTYNIDISGASDSTELMNRIINATNNGHPNNHYTQLQIKDGKLQVYDNRNYDPTAASNPINPHDGDFGSGPVPVPAPSASLSIKLPDGTKLSTASTVSLADDPYGRALAAENLSLTDPGAIIFVPETGEVLFGKNAYQELEKQAGTGGGEIQFSYAKNQWSNGDLRPEHYFACKATTSDEAGNEKTVNYNQEYLRTGKQNNQKIEYDVGYNQKIQVNTNADEVFTHGLDRDVEDLERAISDLERIDATKTDLETVLKGLQEGTAEYAKVQKQYETAEKAYSYIRENVHKMFEQAISRSQKYLDDSNEAITDNGTRGQRLDLVSNRLAEQKTTFKTLQSENEDADIAEVAIQLTASELTYNAALMATSKIMQTSLMNYI